MDKTKYFFAVDLGATSGRTIIGSLSDGKIVLEELTRFGNNLIETGGHVYWDIYALYSEIINGLKIVAKRGIDIVSIGIDTWGCDFLCVGRDGAILRNPLAYRDPHTVGVMERYFDEAVDKQTVYGKTGIQFMNFNSLFQLYARRTTLPLRTPRRYSSFRMLSAICLLERQYVNILWLPHRNC